MRFFFFLFLFFISNLSWTNEEGPDQATLDCVEQYRSSDEFRTGDQLTRGYRTYLTLSEDCKTRLMGLIEFRSALDEIITSYEASVERGLTIDSEVYRGVNSILGNNESSAMLDRIDENRRQAQARCGGENARDFRSRLPEVRDQGSTGWCYAYSTADLASFHSGKNISARHIAQVNNVAINQETLATGAYNSVASLIGAASVEPQHLSREGVQANNLTEAFSQLQNPSLRDGGIETNSFLRVKARGGFCLENDIPSGSHEEEDIGDVIEVFRSFDEQYRNSGTDADRNGLVDSFCNDNKELLERYFPNGFTEGVRNALLSGAGGDSFQYLSQEQCRERVSMEEFKTDVFPVSREGDARNAIDSLLDGESIASVNYETDFLGQERFDDNGELLDNTHSSTVVGRRFDEESGRCQYLLRNSWGSDCSVYSAAQDIECDGGNVWVNEDVLDHHSFGVVGLRK